jgi:methyl-accepting chemotaxis protein
MNTTSLSGQSKSGTASKQPRASFWRTETINQKLTLGFLVILVLLAVSGAVAYIELARVGKNTIVMEDASMRAMSASHLQRLAETTLLPVHDYILTGDASAKAQFEKEAAELDATVAELEGKASSTGTDTGGMAMGNTNPTTSTALSSDQVMLLGSFNEKWMSVHDGAEKIFAITNPVANSDAINQLKEMEASAESMSAYAESIHEVQMGNVSQSRISANETIINTSWFLVAAVVGAFMLGALLSRLIGRAISLPMAQLTQISSNISMGDLDTKVEVRAGGEIGELAGAIERMRTSLKMVIERMSDEEEDLRTWTSQLVSHELRRKVRGGIISLGGRKYEVGKTFDGQYVTVKLDYDLREIIITPPFGEAKHLPLSA